MSTTASAISQLLDALDRVPLVASALTKGTLIVLIAVCLTRLLGRAPAAARHLVWTLAVSGLQSEDPAGFGILQRDRDFASYPDLETQQERRPSGWVESTCSAITASTPWSAPSRIIIGAPLISSPPSSSSAG